LFSLHALSKLPVMSKRFWLFAAGFAVLSSVSGFAQVELANLREDVRGLTQRLGELSLKVEQLERENSDLRSKNQSSERSYATVAQLNDAISDLNRVIKSAVANSKNETLQLVATQMEKMGKQTNAALDSLAKSQRYPAGGHDFLRGGLSQGGRQLHRAERRYLGRDCQEDRRQAAGHHQRQ